MMTHHHARITAIGSYVPAKRLTNGDLERMLDTDDAWIVQRTGVRERRIAAEEEFTSHLCIKAVEDMLRHYLVTLYDVDLILVATYTPDLASPSVACLVQHHFGIPAAGAVDLNAACTGFVYALHMANGLIAAGLHQKILVLGADTASKILDYADRSSCILFGDGAGAVLLERAEQAAPSFLAHHFGSDGGGGAHLYRSGLSRTLWGQPLQGDGLFRQNGKEVYRFVVSQVPEGIRTLLAELQWSSEEIDWFIPHSSNLRMIESLSARAGIPMAKTLYSLTDYGNTSAASIPLTLDHEVKRGTIRPGDRLLLYGFGGGFTHGGLILAWK